MPNVPNSNVSLAILEDTSIQTVFIWIYAVVCIIFVGHWLVASYHWYTYGSERRISLLSIGIYGGSGLVILLLMGTLVFGI